MNAYFFESKVVNRKDLIVQAPTIATAWRTLTRSERVSLKLAREDWSIRTGKFLRHGLDARLILGQGRYFDMAGRWAGLIPDRGTVCKRLSHARTLSGRLKDRQVLLVAEVLASR